MKDYLTIFNKLQSIDENILTKDEFNISKVLFFSKHSFNDLKNPFVLFGKSEHIILMKRFETPLYQNSQSICLRAVYF